MADKMKFDIDVETKKAVAATKKLEKAFNALGGSARLAQVKGIKKLESGIKALDSTSQKSTGLLSKFTKGIAAGNLAATAAEKAIGLLVSAIKEVGEAIMIAAEVEELGAVLKFVGQNAGYSSKQIDGYVKALRKSGIAQKETNQALLRAVQGQIDLNAAVKLGRIAQDAAVIGQMNSSEAYQILIDAVVKGRVVMLKSLGIQGTFNQAYKDMAKTLGKAQTELTETERKQARLNLVFKGGEVIAGAYETSMGFASKQIRSMDRHVQNLQVTIGKYFTPALNVLVETLTDVLKGFNTALGGDVEDSALNTAVAIGEITASLILVTKILVNTGQIAQNIFEMAFIDPILSVIVAAKALSMALSDPLNSEAWENAGRVASGVFDGFKTDWKDIKRHVKDGEDAVLAYAGSTSQLENLKITPPDIVKPPEPEVTEADQGIKDAALATRAKWLATYNMMGEYSHGWTVDVTNDVDKMVGEYEKGGKAIVDSFNKAAKPSVEVKDDAKDMSKYYDAAAAGAGRLAKALYEGGDAGKAMLSVAMQLASTLIGGPFGSFLGGLFDDPLNDAMMVRKSRSATQDILKERHRMAGFVAEGTGQAIRDSGGSLPSSGAVSMGDINVIIQGNADESTVEKVREVLRNELPQMIKDGEVAVPTTDRRHGR